MPDKHYGEPEKPKCKAAGTEECPVAKAGYPNPGKLPEDVAKIAKECKNAQLYTCPYLALYYYYSNKKKEEAKKSKCKDVGTQDCPVAAAGYPKPGKLPKDIVETAKKCEKAQQYVCPYLLAYYYYYGDVEKAGKEKKEGLELADLLASISEADNEATLLGIEELAVALWGEGSNELAQIKSALSEKREAIAAASGAQDAEPSAAPQDANEQAPTKPQQPELTEDTVVSKSLSEAYSVESKDLMQASKVKVKIGPLDKPNKNDRIYPSEVIEAHLPEMRERIAQGKAFCCINHPDETNIDPYMIVARVSDAGVVEDNGEKFMSFVLEFVDGPATDRLKQLVASGINFDLSTRATGLTKFVTDQDGKTYEKVVDYDWLGLDFVTQSGFPSQSLVLEHLERLDRTSGGEVGMSEELKPIESQPEPEPQPVATPEPMINEEKITELARKAVFEAQAATLTERAVNNLADELGLDENWRKALAQSVGQPNSFEELEARINAARDMYSKLLETVPIGAKPATHVPEDAQLADKASSIDEVIERHVQEVHHPEVYKTLLYNLAHDRIMRPIFEVHTKDGWRKYRELREHKSALEEAVTTSDIIYWPLLLPMVDMVWRELAVLDLVLNVPIKRAKGTVPKLKIQLEGNTSLDLGSYAYSVLEDAGEAQDKPLLKLAMESVDFTVASRKAAFEWSDEVEEDLSADWGISPERVLQAASLKRMALEMNLDVLGAIAAAATASGSTATFGTVAPTGSSTRDWLRDGFSMTLANLISTVSAASAVAPTWIVCGSNAAVLIHNLVAGSSDKPVTAKRGTLGFEHIGTYNGLYDVYQVDQFIDPNIVIVGSTPGGAVEEALPAAGVVFMPYVLGKLTDVEIDARKNKKVRGLHSRYAVVTLRNDIYGILTIAPGETGVWPLTS